MDCRDERGDNGRCKRGETAEAAETPTIRSRDEQKKKPRVYVRTENARGIRELGQRCLRSPSRGIKTDCSSKTIGRTQGGKKRQGHQTEREGFVSVSISE